MKRFLAGILLGAAAGTVYWTQYADTFKRYKPKLVVEDKEKGKEINVTDKLQKATK